MREWMRCGKPFEGTETGLQRFCSKNCKKADWLDRHPEQKEKYLSIKRARSVKILKDKRLNNKCLICGSPILERYLSAKVCSRECNLERWRREAYKNNSAKKEIAPRKCKHCGVLFIPEYGDKRRQYCSQTCMKLAGKKNRDYRERMNGGSAVMVSRLIIFERDGWTCQICGANTPKELTGTTEDNAPELDHIIPLSKGGDHHPDNVQCCCRVCNIFKGNKSLDEFKEWAGVA